MTTDLPFGALRALAACLLPLVLTAQEPGMQKPYDVRFLLEPDVAWNPAVRLLPENNPRDSLAVGSAADAAASAMDEGALLALLKDAIGARFSEDRGTKLDLAGGLLLATCDATTHQQVGAWIELCRQVFLEQVTFEMHVLPGTALSGGRGVLTREEAETLLRTTGPHATYLASTRIGAAMLLQANDSTTFVRDFDVEVAQSATIRDPKLELMVAGRGWTVSAHRCLDNRLEVHVAGEQADPHLPIRTQAVPSRDLRGKAESGVIQLPTIRYGRQTAGAVLADGEAMLFGSGDPKAEVYCLRLRRPHSVPMPSGPDWSWIAVGDLVHAPKTPGHAHLRVQSPSDDAPLASEPQQGPARVIDSALLVERLRTVLQGNDDGDPVTVLPFGLLQIRAPEPARKAAIAMLEQLASAMVRQLTVEVRFGRLGAGDAASVADGRLDSGELAGKLSAAYLTPCVLHDTFTMLAGSQRSYLRDYEVEIAQDGALSNPVVGNLLTGIAVSGRLDAATRNQYRLDLRVSWGELAGEIESFDLKDDRFGPVELPRMRDLQLHSAPIVDANKWILMHLAPLHGTDEHFAVVARIRE